MKIIQYDNVPDSKYFTLSDVEPILRDNTLTIYNGRGSHRSWGTPQTTSTVIVNTKTFTAIHVGFSHKHRGGQGWFYYLQGQRVHWDKLPKKRQTQVLKSDKTPAWAKAPGLTDEEKQAKRAEAKAKAEAEKAERIGYKILRLMPDGRMVSFYDPEVEYVLGQKMSQKAKPGHRGGYYFFDNDLMATYQYYYGYLPNSRNSVGIRYAAVLVEVTVSGHIVHYDRDKFAASHMTPTRIVQQWGGA